MELIEGLQLGPPIEPTLLLPTPLGTFKTSASFDGQEIVAAAAGQMGLLPDGGYAVQWATARYICELICCRPSLRRDYWDMLDDCWAFLWRLKAIAALPQMQFRCEWQDDARYTDGGGDSGQYLEAQTWNDDQIMVTLGTEGNDALFRRAQQGRWLPTRYLTQADLSSWRLPLVAHLKHGLLVNFGALTPGEAVQAHFAVAWAGAQQETYPTWSAVNIAERHIIAGARGARVWRTPNKGEE